MKVVWQNLSTMVSQQYTCGYCKMLIASQTGYHSTAGNSLSNFSVRICPNCTMPTIFSPAGQLPGSPYGDAVAHLPENIDKTYAEAQKSYSAGAFTASVLMCRKMLMNIAVEKGANAGESFASYVNFLASKNYVPPGSQTWVDHIRGKGNEATHEIHFMTQAEAEELLSFTSMMLKFIYEFPGKMAIKLAP